MNDQHLNNEVLMVLPRKTVYKETTLDENWILDQDFACLSLRMAQEQLANAYLKDEDDFGMMRPRIHFECPNDEQRTKFFEALTSRLALEYDKTPSKYALYIRLYESDLDLIAQASRMGFVPYFGQWNKKSADESEKDWERITESLRQVYPAKDNLSI